MKAPIIHQIMERGEEVQQPICSFTVRLHRKVTERFIVKRRGDLFNLNEEEQEDKTPRVNILKHFDKKLKTGRTLSVQDTFDVAK